MLHITNGTAYTAAITFPVTIRLYFKQYSNTKEKVLTPGAYAVFRLPVCSSQR